MKVFKFFVSLAAFLFSSVTYAQVVNISKYESSVPLFREITANTVLVDNPADTGFSQKREPGEMPPVDFEELKTKLPKLGPDNYADEVMVLGKQNGGEPVVGSSFNAINYSGGTPPDNSIAINDDGVLVAAINVRIAYYNKNGSQITARTISSLVNDVSMPNSGFYDPRVIFDPQSNRFIFVVLYGSTAATSKVVVCFSKTSNPSDGWNVYKLSGDLALDGSWFDYPNIAVTNNELIITGNLFDDANNFSQAAIIQIDKNTGYAGTTLKFQNWYGIKDGKGNLAITLVPAVQGDKGNYGPDLWMVSNENQVGNAIHLFHLTNEISATNESIVSSFVSTDTYAGPQLGSTQLGTTRRLDNQKTRIRGAYQMNGIIHFAFGCVNANGYTMISFNRYEILTKLLTTKYLGLNGTNFAFPNVMSFSNLSTINTTMLLYCASNSNIYPGVRIVTVDDKMNFGTSQVIKAGEGYVRYGIGSDERWGDYSGIAKSYRSAVPEVWIFGNYGNTSNIWGNWVAQLTANADIPVPSDTTSSFAINPNPSTGYLIVEINTPTSGDVMAEIYSMNGQKVQTELWTTVSGKNRQRINTSQLLSGQYVIEVKSNGQPLGKQIFSVITSR